MNSTLLQFDAEALWNSCVAHARTARRWCPAIAPSAKIVSDDETDNFDTAPGLVMLVQGSASGLQRESLMANGRPLDSMAQTS